MSEVGTGRCMLYMVVIVLHLILCKPNIVAALIESGNDKRYGREGYTEAQELSCHSFYSLAELWDTS